MPRAKKSVLERGEGLPRGHRKEIYGVLSLAAAVFLTLCLFSYVASDPSFTTLAVGQKVQNLGGVVGSHLSDLLFALLGYGAYLIPFALLAVSVTHFAQRNLKDLKFGWVRILAYAALILFFSLFSHLKFGDVQLGGREADAGGVLGWWGGAKLARFFGRPGAYIAVGSGLLLSVLIITRLSIVQMAQLFRSILAWMTQKTTGAVSSAFVIGWARFRKNLSRMGESIAARFKRDKKDAPAPVRVEPKIIHGAGPARPAPEARTEARPTPPLKIVPPSAAERPAEAAPPPPPPEPKVTRSAPAPMESLEPKILPRVDIEAKKSDKRDQLDLISPVVADFQLPQLSFLDSESQDTVKVDEESLKLNSKMLEKKLLDFDVEGHITEIHPGPVITMYEFQPAAGVKVNKIVNLEDDLSLTMGGKSVRIIAPLPGKAAVGIEIPNNTRETVWLKDVIGHSKFLKAESPLTLAIGKDTEGIPYVADLAKMPHLLVAGATGAGKSVCINSMILSFLYKATPQDVRMIMVDPKMLELSIYGSIPHLLLPVVTNPKKASMALRWAVREMERRYEILSAKGTRNIGGYNKLVSQAEKMPYIVIIIDELADLMMTAAKDVENSVARLAQMARAAGIHLILATQRPSVDVLTGLIKANFPARISFKVSSKHDSRTIIDTVGAEHLLGYGDMLYTTGGAGGLLRVHGAFVSETEINRVVDHWKTQGAPEFLDESVLKPMEEASSEGGAGGDEDHDELYDQAVQIVCETRQASISMIQRRLRIGYNRAARLIEKMEAQGVVGPADGSKPREVYAQNLTSNDA
ncbi:MAG TPA: DNA translocase FtsK 4TM domain-containing protein [bacterium]|nr:DNA translocase FtsK 4TM domain-containing protein [bacterium]